MKIGNCKLEIAKRQGFTLIELLVAMAIIGILAATAIVNFGKNNDRDVRQEKNRLTSFLREIQNKALAGDREGIPSGGKICGFGFTQTGSVGSTMGVFYVATNDLDADCKANWKSYPKTGYGSFQPLNGTTEIFSGTVIFLSPNGATDCDGCALPISSVTLSTSKGSATATTTVDPSGRIY